MTNYYCWSKEDETGWGIEREKFRAIQVEDLNKLSADKVFKRMLGLLN